MSHAPKDPMTPRASDCLARVLDVLDDHTQAPLRVNGHATSWTHEVFEVQEEFELGPRGRRFLLSVAATARDALLVPLRGASEECR
ncbi:MAG: hypothetical protein U0Y82_15925 [Thermoleophilia bacterium]